MADDHTVALETDKQKLSYIFGVQAGQNIAAEGIDLDVESFAAGVSDMIQGERPRLDQATAERLIGAYQESRAKQMAEELNQRAAKAKEFMEANGKREGVITTESGLQYEVLEAGDGATPSPSDKVIAHYHGTLLDGTVFDSSYDRGEPATFPVNGVIPGWQEVLQLMREGSKYRVTIPGQLAYGMRGAPPAIGPNETLLFDIELIAITQ